ncbi:hypothetical protein GGI10_001786 [Coemansia sp. RSA 2530]|nr:hypothetical protein GGI10_001786 [Coemansia sp. RSA 2530]
MDRESVRPSVAPETPLSVTFRDSAFMNFVNDVHPANTLLHQDAASGHAQQRPEGNGARHGANASTNEEEARPPRKAYETPPQQSSSALHDDVPGSSDRPQLGQSASLAPSNNNNNQASLEADDDFFEDLDRLNFTSQALRELTEPDENSFHIREQCNNSASNMLSQDFAEARIDDSDLQKGTTGAGAAKGVRAMSAPGPTISTLAPATPVAGNLAVSVSSVDSNAQSRQTNVAGRGKVNLYPRLAQHIPPRPDSTSYYSQRPPQVGHYGKSATLANDSPTRGSVPRQQQQQRFKPYAHSISNPGFHSGTSSSAPVLAASKQKPPHASTQNTGAEASDALAELARLRAENERMRVEAEQLRAQLYTKEGEVKIYFTRGLCLDGLLGVVGLLTTLIQVSPTTWGYLRGSPGDFERLLLAIMRRLQVASLANDALMLDGKRAFLVLIASAIVTHETDTPVLINSMRRFTMGMVQWFLDEHALLTRRRWAVADSERRVQVFFEYIKCLNVVLSEIKDVVVLLGGDNSPLFFGFVATCTRMTLGEGVFDGVAPIRELAGDLLAYVVTEDQAVSIQNLYI